MQAKELLRKLDVGSSVAEDDAMLERYFVETETFRSLVAGRVDVVAGDKGAGKSALYRILSERYSWYPDLSDVEVISAFNPSGTPVFQRLLESELLSEQSYINIWKAYFLALGGNWLLELADGDFTDSMLQLDALLRRVSLRSPDDTALGVFSRLYNRVKHMLGVKKVEVSGKLTVAEITAKIDFLADEPEPDPGVTWDEALRLLNSTLAETEIRFWLAVDRLDEAFQGQPELERRALRGLLRAFLDMQEFDRLRPKLFLRKDLFRRITSGGFVNLTHVNSRKVEIEWDELDLDNLLYKRIMENGEFVEDAKISTDASTDDVFYRVFPAQVDVGDRKPNTWTWIMGRVADANGVRAPRNLIDLVLKARQAQLRREDRSPREDDGGPLIFADAIKRGQEAMSQQRVEDTLLAEAGSYAPIIEKFRRGKAEHNEESLRVLLGDDFRDTMEYLSSIGFIERIGSSYKIPMLYRWGLEVTQGKAF